MVNTVQSAVTVESIFSQPPGPEMIVKVVGRVTVEVASPNVNVVSSGQYVVSTVCSTVIVRLDWVTQTVGC